MCYMLLPSFKEVSVKHAASVDHFGLPETDSSEKPRRALLYLSQHELERNHRLHPAAACQLCFLSKVRHSFVACASQVPRLAAVQGTSVLSGRQSQKMTFGGTKTRMAHPTLRWTKGEGKCSRDASAAWCQISLGTCHSSACASLVSGLYDQAVLQLLPSSRRVITQTCVSGKTSWIGAHAGLSC